MRSARSSRPPSKSRSQSSARAFVYEVKTLPASAAADTHAHSRSLVPA